MPLARAVGIIKICLDRRTNDHMRRASRIANCVDERPGESGVTRFKLFDVLWPINTGQMEDDVRLQNPLVEFRLGVVEVVKQQTHIIPPRKMRAKIEAKKTASAGD